MPVIHGASNESEPKGSTAHDSSDSSDSSDDEEPEKKQKKEKKEKERQEPAKDEPVRKSKFTMSTSEEQAKSKRQIDTERKQRE